MAISIAESMCFIGNLPKNDRITTEVSMSTAVERLDIIIKPEMSPTGTHRGKKVSLKVSFLP